MKVYRYVNGRKIEQEPCANPPAQQNSLPVQVPQRVIKKYGNPPANVQVVPNAAPSKGCGCGK